MSENKKLKTIVRASPGRWIFFPRDKPKSWIIANLSGLTGVFVGGPLMLSGDHFASETMRHMGMLVFLLCFIVFSLMWIIGIFNLLSGRYARLEERNWKDQVW